MLGSNQGLLCVTADQQFLFYSLNWTEELLQLSLTKRLVGYNEEVVDMKFVGDDEKFLALATNLEQV
jgi:U3 small nucleolar RNA-associated protein 13